MKVPFEGLTPLYKPKRRGFSKRRGLVKKRKLRRQKLELKKPEGLKRCKLELDHVAV